MSFRDYTVWRNNQANDAPPAPAVKVWCRAPQKKAPEFPCTSYVGSIPATARVVGPIPHSDDARHPWVMRCGRCGTLYEIEDKAR